MELHQIRYFLAVADTLNFTRAAEQCHVAQPSLTRAIKNLEGELGGDLFRRERSASHLTSLGRAMLPLLKQSYDSAQAAKSQAESYGRGDKASLRMTLSESVDFDLVTDAFNELGRAFSDVQFFCFRTVADDIIERLKSGDTEVALAGPIDDSWGRLESWPLFTEPFYAVVNKDHRYAAMEQVSIDQLVGERLILRPFCEQSDPCHEVLEAHGVDLGYCHEISSERDAVRLLEANLGVGVLPGCVRIGERLRRLPLAEAPLRRTIRLYSVAGRQRSHAVAGLLTLLRAADWSSFETTLPAS